jgi:hypothetical protein
MITTMLHLFQCPSETTKVEPVIIPKEKRKELRILDALAALLIREYENVAVMEKHFDGKSIQVIAVVNLNKLGSAVTGPIRLGWLASLNSRFSSPMFPGRDEDEMRVVDPDTRVDQIFLEHQNNPVMLLNTFLQTQW